MCNPAQTRPRRASRWHRTENQGFRIRIVEFGKPGFNVEIDRPKPVALSCTLSPAKDQSVAPARADVHSAPLQPVPESWGQNHPKFPHFELGVLN
jgi:hypothetical protein